MLRQHLKRGRIEVYAAHDRLENEHTKKLRSWLMVRVLRVRIFQTNMTPPPPPPNHAYIGEGARLGENVDVVGCHPCGGYCAQDGAYAAERRRHIVQDSILIAPHRRFRLAHPSQHLLVLVFYNYFRQYVRDATCLGVRYWEPISRSLKRPTDRTTERPNGKPNARTTDLSTDKPSRPTERTIERTD